MRTAADQIRACITRKTGRLLSFLIDFVKLHADEGISGDLHALWQKNNAMERNGGQRHGKELFYAIVMRGIELERYFVRVSDLVKRVQDSCLLFHEDGSRRAVLDRNNLVGLLNPVQVELTHIALAVVDGNLGTLFVGHGIVGAYVTYKFRFNFFQ